MVAVRYAYFARDFCSVAQRVSATPFAYLNKIETLRTCVRSFGGVGAPRSALCEAAIAIHPHIVAASVGSYSGTLPSTLRLGRAEGDWEDVRRQAALVSNWASHPLDVSERLGLAGLLLDRACVLSAGVAIRGDALRLLFAELERTELKVFRPCVDGTSKCAIVAAFDKELVAEAGVECAALLLRGFAVSLAAPLGLALDAAIELGRDVPLGLFQVVPLGELDTRPASVQCLRLVGGPSPPEVWREFSPPIDFGGVAMSPRYPRCYGYGANAGASALALVRTDLSSLALKPRVRFELCDTASDVLGLLSTTQGDHPIVAGLPVPRWAHSAYGRGVEEVHDFLDLLWTFQEWVELPTSNTRGTSAVRLVAADKHFVVSASSATEIPEEVVKAAAIATLSPFDEPITLHAVGFGERGLSKDPLRSFCRLVESGQSGLCWRVVEHKSWEAFLANAVSKADSVSEAKMDATGPSLFFGSTGARSREMVAGLRRIYAAAGGIAWDGLFVPDPLEQVRRWTRLSVCDSDALRGVGKMRPAFEVRAPLPVSD